MRSFGTSLLTAIDEIGRASNSEGVLEILEKALADIGADYNGVLFIPQPGERIEDVCLAWRAPDEWRALYSGENMCQRDPVIRFAARSVIAFDWMAAPCDAENEPHMKEVQDLGRECNIHKGVSIPIPSPNGIVGIVWVAGPHFEERETHMPLLQTLGLHVFHRLEQLAGRNPRRKGWLTDREREVLTWAADGKTAWEIGCILNLSQRTIEWHFREAYRKLGATNRSQAIALMASSRGDPVEPAQS
jgi:LuxR family transcriptional regulator, quorum-sensing system regulator BjaR1